MKRSIVVAVVAALVGGVLAAVSWGSAAAAPAKPGDPAAVAVQRAGAALAQHAAALDVQPAAGRQQPRLLVHGARGTGSWNISAYAGQSVRILIEATDASTASLIEAGVDDVSITQS